MDITDPAPDKTGNQPTGIDMGICRWNAGLARDMIGRNTARLFMAVLAASIVPVYTHAGTLQLGDPVVSDNRYTFPVLLQGDGEEVAALDFRLGYDPSVFSPVSAQSGPTALQAQKQVSSNVPAPGEFVVVLMGFNQNAVASGEVVQVVLEKIGEPASGSTVLRIAEPTLATNVGIEVDSRGVGRTIRFSEPDRENAKPEADEKSPDDTETERDGRATDDRAGSGDSVRGPAGAPLFVTRADGSGGAGVEPGAQQAAPGPAARPETGGADTPEGATQGNTPPVDGSGAMATPSGTAETGSPAKRTQSNGENGAIAANAGDTPDEGPEAQTTEQQELTKGESSGMGHSEKKGGQTSFRYATLLTLAAGVVLGLVIVFRVAGK